MKERKKYTVKKGGSVTVEPDKKPKEKKDADK